MATTRTADGCRFCKLEWGRGRCTHGGHSILRTDFCFGKQHETRVQRPGLLPPLTKASSF